MPRSFLKFYVKMHSMTAKVAGVERTHLNNSARPGPATSADIAIALRSHLLVVVVVILSQTPVMAPLLTATAAFEHGWQSIIGIQALEV